MNIKSSSWRESFVGMIKDHYPFYCHDCKKGFRKKSIAENHRCKK